MDPAKTQPKCPVKRSLIDKFDQIAAQGNLPSSSITHKKPCPLYGHPDYTQANKCQSDPFLGMKKY
jgi:hypothetical protein